MTKLPSENILPSTPMCSKEKGHTRNSVKGGKSVKDVPSLGRDVDLWQVTLDRQSATASQRQKLKTLRISAWNVRTLYQKGKLNNVVHEIERIKIDILGIAEVRWTQKGIFQKDEHTVIYSSGDTHKRGVGLILNSYYCKNNERILGGVGSSILAKLGKETDYNLIQVYAPTAEASEEEITEFTGNWIKESENVRARKWQL